MTAFTVWKFDDPAGAAHADDILKRAEEDDLVEVLDHATVSWPLGAKHPTVQHGHDHTKHGAALGGFWGLLFGLLFTVPVLGIAVGAGLGALAKASEKLGITEEELEEIRAQVTEGTSALFVVTDQGNLDRLGERFRGVKMTLVQTNLTPAERELLLETFAG